LKENFRLSKSTQPTHRAGYSAVDVTAAAVVLLFAGLISLFAIRNNDIWWLLAVARRIVETRSFITEDPFTFTATGTPWAPQAYLSALVFYAVNSVGSAWGLIVLRVILVVSIFGVSLWTLRRVGAPWVFAAPVVLVVLLNAHSRFLVRAHLFEYLFVAVLMWFLLTAGRRRGKSFFLIPVVVQLLWVNMHPSFALGPVLVALFFAGEWIAGVVSGRLGFIRPYHRDGCKWRRVALLVLLMCLACLLNPAPGLFLTQPFGSEQRELISRFTLEWRSPFDPALSHGAFHPWYEILLGLSALSLILAVGRLPLAPALLMVATAVLSFQAHRFRVEFALVVLPVMFVLFQSSPIISSLGRTIRKKKNGVYIARSLALAFTGVIIAFANDRIEIGKAIADRYPHDAFQWVRSNGVALRPFHTIGHGSYLLWDLYGERSSFIDGRNFSPPVYRDFLACQMNEQGRRGVAEKYNLDAYILPPIEKSDAGIDRVHRSLIGDDGWSLCFVDEHAWIYVKDASVQPAWLRDNGFRAYHPLTLQNRRVSDEEMRLILDDLQRAVGSSPDYVRIRVDLAMVYLTLGNPAAAAVEIDRALEIDPQNKTALELRGRLRNQPR
jgi:hypothetical protein